MTINAPRPKAGTNEQANKTSAPTEQTAASAPAIQGKREAPPTCEKECQKAKQRKKEDLRAQQGMARAADELVTLTAWQIGVGALGITLLIITLGYTRKATRAATKAAEAGQDAARAAQESVKVVSDTAERQLRAYVSVEDITSHPDLDLWVIQVRWKNTGSTPARKAATRFNWREFSDNIPDNFDFPDLEKAPKNDPASLGPEQYLFSWPARIEHDVIVKLPTGNSRIYVWGWAGQLKRYCHPGQAGSTTNLRKRVPESQAA